MSLTPPPPLVPHTLHLVDPGPGAEAALRLNDVLTRSKGIWTASRRLSIAFIFPSFQLAHRYAKHFRAGQGQTWMPISVAGMASDVPHADQSCRICGCTDEFPGPTDLSWHEQDLCGECAKPWPGHRWTVFAPVEDLYPWFVARRMLEGIPTEACVRALTHQGLNRPPELKVVAREPHEPAAVVEHWIRG